MMSKNMLYPKNFDPLVFKARFETVSVSFVRRMIFECDVSMLNAQIQNANEIKNITKQENFILSYTMKTFKISKKLLYFL